MSTLYLFVLAGILFTFGFVSYLNAVCNREDQAERLRTLKGPDAFLVMEMGDQFYPALTQNMLDWIECDKKQTQPL
jgi:hypothetical protein